MAYALKYDKKHIDPTTATVLLYRGDDWKLTAKVVDRFARYEDEVDLTNAQVEVLFQAEDNSASAFAVALQVPGCGEVQIDIPASATSELALQENGSTNYVVVSHPALGIFTAQSIQQVEIRDRGFTY